MARKYHKAERTIELMGDLFSRAGYAIDEGEDYSFERRRLDLLQPKTRGECASARAAMYADLPDGHPTKEQAPCPWMRCRYHLHLDVNYTVKHETDLEEIVHHKDAPYEHTCVLDFIEASEPTGPEANPERAPSTMMEELEDEERPETNEGLVTDQAIGQALSLCDESVRLIWNRGLEKMRPRAEVRCT